MTRMDEPGLRERKRQRTHDSIVEAALRLFLERGFDAVSVAEISAEAEVSKPTLFRYFASKEDLVVGRIADHEDEAARVVRGRETDESPVAALHAHFVDGLRRHDPITGLSDQPAHQALYRLIESTPSLLMRMRAFLGNSVVQLAEALREATPDDPLGITAELAAEQVIIVQRRLAQRNLQLITAGAAAAEVYPEAVAAANHAFTLLRDGVGGYYG